MSDHALDIHPLSLAVIWASSQRYDRLEYPDKSVLKPENCMANSLAPCVAIVGPANAGKTTLLNQLDQELQKLLESVLVIKGNPDGTGRYLFHQPDLRDAVKPEVKGRWSVPTVERIRQWVENGRRNLELALLDFGGRHGSENDAMLSVCSHYIVVSRLEDDSGGASWDEVCRRSGLKPIAWIRSMWREGEARMEEARNRLLTGRFRSDASRVGDDTNAAVIDALVKELMSIRRPPEETPYVNLHLDRDWTEEDLADLAGRDRAVRELAETAGAVALGGVAPIWAYLAATRRALLENSAARVFFFDPKEERRLVEIPAGRVEGPFPQEMLKVEWERHNNWWRLHVQLTTTDRFLPPDVAERLESAPSFGPVPEGPVEIFGARPTWVAGTYARWLWAAGVSRLGVWDGRSNGPVWL